MTDDNRTLALAGRAPALRGMRHVGPILESPSQTWRGRSTRLLKKHADRFEQSNRVLRAYVIEAVAMRALAEGRIEAAKRMTDLAALREICAAHFLKARRQRASDLLVHELECQAKEIHSRVSLAMAQRHQAAFPAPEPPAPAVASSEQELTSNEIEELLRQMPEIEPDMVRTLAHLLAGRLKEKRG